jgi:hypothetical protein
MGFKPRGRKDKRVGKVIKRWESSLVMKNVGNIERT